MGIKALHKWAALSGIMLLPLAGCAQMPLPQNHAENQVNENHTELRALAKKQQELSLATLAISMKLGHVQRVISQRLQAGQPLIAAPKKAKMVKSIVVTMPNGGQSTKLGSCNPESITVKTGDTLSGIAAATDTTVTQLQAWNTLHGSVIVPGEVLITSKCPGGNG